MLRNFKYLPLLCLFSLLPDFAYSEDQPAIDDRAVLNGFTNFLSTHLKMDLQLRLQPFANNSNAKKLYLFFQKKKQLQILPMTRRSTA